MVGINYGSGDIGAGIGFGLRDPWAELFAPSSQGYARLSSARRSRRRISAPSTRCFGLRLSTV